jgi:hypothetical protein
LKNEDYKREEGQKEGNGEIHMGFCALGQLSLEEDSFTSDIVASEKKKWIK